MDKANQACIVIPIYRILEDPYELAAVAQCFKILGHYQIFFVLPIKMERYIQSHPYVLSGQASYKLFDDAYFADIPGYNRLLKSARFYREFLNYNYLLIYQTDAYVFKDELLYWCNKGFDNIGAPLFEGHDLATTESPMVGQGNGGFCLRNVQACYHVVTTWRKVNYPKQYSDENPSILRKIYRNIKHRLIYNYSYDPFQPIMNEDLFWAELVPKAFPAFKVPKPIVALGFSFEMNPELLLSLNHNKLPFGCHAWRRYSTDFWQKYISIDHED